MAKDVFTSTWKHSCIAKKIRCAHVGVGRKPLIFRMGYQDEVRTETAVGMSQKVDS
jgi:hypothetical protein